MGYVERSHRTDDDEFWLVKELSPETEELRAQVKRWQQEYNTERPHQALGYLTPDEFYDKVTNQPQKCR